MSRAGNREEFELLLDHLPVCVHRIDRRGKLSSMNAAGLRMMGASLEQVVGRPYLQTVGDEDRPRVARLLERALNGSA
jgi:PAS domain S-box-containing protein